MKEKILVTVITHITYTLVILPEFSFNVPNPEKTEFSYGQLAEFIKEKGFNVESYSYDMDNRLTFICEKV